MILQDDVAAEPSETLIVGLRNPSSGVIPSATGATVTLTDNDTATSPSYGIAVTNDNILENTGTAAYTITRSGNLDASTSYFRTNGGTATAGVGNDYTAISGQTLSWAAGETSKVVFVTLLDDATVESTETLFGEIATDSGFTSGNATASLNLLDKDAIAYTVAAVGNAFENAGTVAGWSVSRSGNTDVASTSYFRTTTGGTATAGSDYTDNSGQTLSWAAGETSKVVYLTLTDDAVAESSETVTGQIATDSGFTTGLATANTTVQDNDASGINAYAITATGSPYESAGVLAYTVTRSGDLTIASTSYFHTLGTGTAAPGTDFTAVTGQTLNWGVGEATKVVTVALGNDGSAEASETIIAQIATDSGFTTGLLTATGTVLDDDSQTMAAGVADTLTMGTSSGTYLGGQILDTGDLDDAVTIGATASTVNTVINLGDGNDTLDTNTAALFLINGAQYIGGAGVDTLQLGTNTTAYSFSTTTSVGNLAKGFEIVNMTAAGNQTVNLSLQDVLEFTAGNTVANTLRITGNAGDILNLQALGKTLGTQAPGTGNLTDVDGTTYDVVASAAGNASANDVSIGGATYDVYQYQHGGQTLNLLVNTLLTTSVI